MTIRPIRNVVLILKDPRPTAIRGIALPDQGRQQSIFGTVLAAGPGRLVKGELIPPALKPGDRVYCPELGGQTFDDLDPRGPVLLIEDDFIKGIVEDE